MRTSATEKRYSFFTTSSGYDVLVLGYIYNFTQNANSTITTPVVDAVQQPYFAEAMVRTAMHDTAGWCTSVH